MVYKSPYPSELSIAPLLQVLSTRFSLSMLHHLSKAVNMHTTTSLLLTSLLTLTTSALPAHPQPNADQCGPTVPTPTDPKRHLPLNPHSPPAPRSIRHHPDPRPLRPERQQRLVQLQPARRPALRRHGHRPTQQVVFRERHCQRT